MKVFFFGLLISLPATASTWVEDSNAIAKEYALADGERFPERASAMGYTQFDSKALKMEKNSNAEEEAFLLEWNVRVAKEWAKAKDPNLKLDLKILRDHLQRRREEIRLEEKFGVVTFLPGTRFVLESLLTLINDQEKKERKSAAVDRFQAYVRGHGENPPLLSAFRNRSMWDELRFQKKQFLPLQEEVEQYLVESPEYLKGIKELLLKSGRGEWQADYEIFVEQSREYDNYLRSHVLPKARKDFRLPKEIYAHSLRMRGIEASPEDLIKSARKAYRETIKDFRAMAKLVAKAEALKNSEPAYVIAHLKKKQVVKPEEVQKLFESANTTLEDIIRREQLLTLPASPLRIRVAGEVESLASPIPHLDEPPLIGNTGQRPEFVVPSFTSGKSVIDDFSYEAAALVLTAHEGRPGHDLQFSSMLDNGTSVVRARFAFNNANVEGWGLYAEELVYPHLPAQAKLVALQMRLIRVARAFLDPELQLGKIRPSAVTRLFERELGLSARLAGLELRRYQYDNPGQAPSYFYGHTRMRAARSRVANSLGRKFNEKCFHDRVLSLGMLPVGMLGREIERNWNCGKTQARLPSGGVIN